MFNISFNPHFLGILMIGKSIFDVPLNDPNKVRKDIVIEFFNLISEGRPEDGLFFFDSDCRTHNPYIAGGIKELIDGMIAVQKQGPEGIIKGSKADFKLKVRQVLSEGDVVAVHTQVASSTPSDGGLRQVHFPFQWRQDNRVLGHHTIYPPERTQRRRRILLTQVSCCAMTATTLYVSKASQL
jgi:predicted SnoaL-like aldol condensation-catalyzing enzyme